MTADDDARRTMIGKKYFDCDGLLVVEEENKPHNSTSTFIFGNELDIMSHFTFLLLLLILSGGASNARYTTAFTLTSSKPPTRSDQRTKSFHEARRRDCRRNHKFHSIVELSATRAKEEQEEVSPPPTSPKKSKKWFPVKPEDALLTQYDTLVRGAYVRHVLLETEEMVDLAIQTYLRGGSGNGSGEVLTVNDDNPSSSFSAAATASTTAPLMDPFGKLAKDLSACTKSREEHGKIGWIDNPNHPSKDNVPPSMINEVVSDLLPADVIEQIFQSKPKGGDILKVKSKYYDDGDDDSTLRQRWHLCRIDDLLIDYIPNSTHERNDFNDSELMKFKQKGVNKVITSRSKLKGLGTTPTAPKIVVSSSDTVRNDDETTIDTTTSTTSTNIASKYYIATTGCQMNVADSERLAGVLENKLNLEASTSPNDANVVILNTCSIRDHAEQKVYDTLGPFAARKRKGESLALIVSGCVAQQEGEALLKRVPEVDLVMGPQVCIFLDCGCVVSKLVGGILKDILNAHNLICV